MLLKKVPALFFTMLSLNAYADDSSPFDMFISGEVGYNHVSPKVDPSIYDNNIDPIDYSLPNSSDVSYRTRASFSYTDPNQFGLQVDGVYASNGMDKSTASTVDLAGHAFYRTDKYLLGAITQYRKPSLTSKSYNYIPTDIFAPEQFFWGAEAQAYLGQFTLYGQIARQEFINQSNYGIAELGSGLGDHGVALSLKARYFINDNWRVDGTYAYNKVYLNNSILGDTDIFSEIGKSANQNTFGLATEYRFANKPYSITASYEHTSIDLFGGLFSVDTDRAMVGFRLNFGKDSLKARDQSGASLDPISQDALFSTAIGSLFNQILPPT